MHLSEGTAATAKESSADMAKATIAMVVHLANANILMVITEQVLGGYWFYKMFNDSQAY